MNEELQKQLAAMLEQIRNGAEQGAGFVLEQAPMVVQEKILFARVSGLCYMALWLFAAVALFWLGQRLIRSSRDEEDYNDSSFYAAMSMFAFVGSAAGVLFAVIVGHSTLMSWIAPRLYVVEWAVSLASGK